MRFSSTLGDYRLPGPVPAKRKREFITGQDMASSDLVIARANKHGVRLASCPVQRIFHASEKQLRAYCLCSCETFHRATTFFVEFCQFPWW